MIALPALADTDVLPATGRKARERVPGSPSVGRERRREQLQLREGGGNTYPAVRRRHRGCSSSRSRTRSRGRTRTPARRDRSASRAQLGRTEGGTSASRRQQGCGRLPRRDQRRDEDVVVRLLNNNPDDPALPDDGSSRHDVHSTPDSQYRPDPASQTRSSPHLHDVLLRALDGGAVVRRALRRVSGSAAPAARCSTRRSSSPRAGCKNENVVMFSYIARRRTSSVALLSPVGSRATVRGRRAHRCHGDRRATTRIRSRSSTTTSLRTTAWARP